MGDRNKQDGAPRRPRVGGRGADGTSGSKADGADADAGHRAGHRPGQTTALVDFLGDPVESAREGRGPGAPPVVLTDDQAEAAAEALRARVPETRIARALKLNYRTWMRLREEDDRLADAGAEARKLEEEELVAVLLDRARRGETVPLLFALKSRHGYRDQGPAGPGEVSRTNIVINLPASLSPDEYRRMIDVTPVRGEGEKEKGRAR